MSQAIRLSLVLQPRQYLQVVRDMQPAHHAAAKRNDVVYVVPDACVSSQSRGGCVDGSNRLQVRPRRSRSQFCGVSLGVQRGYLARITFRPLSILFAQSFAFTFAPVAKIAAFVFAVGLVPLCVCLRVLASPRDGFQVGARAACVGEAIVRCLPFGESISWFYRLTLATAFQPQFVATGSLCAFVREGWFPDVGFARFADSLNAKCAAGTSFPSDSFTDAEAVACFDNATVRARLSSRVWRTVCAMRQSVRSSIGSAFLLVRLSVAFVRETVSFPAFFGSHRRTTILPQYIYGF